MKNPISAKPLGRISLLTNSTYIISSNPPKFLLQIFRFSTFSPSNVATTSYPSRRHEEESRNVRVSIWWDFENCQVPLGANVFRVAQCITTAIRANGIKGPIQITAFGDVMRISRLNQEALSSTGINLSHIPRGGKNSARSLLVDLMHWVFQNPPPAHIFLISGDRDFAGILHRLRMNNYNILLASPETAPSVLCSAASIMWHWNSLLKGENLLGNHFNQPPDGPYGSWYGHYKAPRKDPFAVGEQTVCAWAECSPDSAPDKFRPIPKTVIEQIRHILYASPKGIPIADLHGELLKSNINIDRDFYGYKKFSRFLLAMPQVLKLQPEPDGQFLVCGVLPKAPKQDEQTPGMTTEHIQNGKEHSALTPSLNVEKNSYIQHAKEKPAVSMALETPMKHTSKQHFFSAEVQEAPEKMQVPPSPEPKLESHPDNFQYKKVHEKPQKFQESSAVVQGVEKAESIQGQMAKNHPVSEPGLFKRIWRKWFGYKDVASEEKNGCAITPISPEKLKSENNVNSTMQKVESIIQTPVLPSCNEAITHNNKLKTSIVDDGKYKRSSGFLDQILRFWRGSVVSDEVSGELKGKMDQIELGSENGIFAKESFWDEVKAFVDTPEGAAIVMQSRTRKEMAENLGKRGPQCLISLSEADLLYLVNLIISDKKWIEESLSQASPFELIRSVEKASFSGPSSGISNSNELSSIFSKTIHLSLSQKLQELDGDRRCQNSPHAVVSRPIAEKNFCRKSENQTISDCQKLVDELLKEHPEGFNLGIFRKMFLEKYGYNLDVHKLGYEKLTMFLQKLPGISVESTYVFPSHNQKSPNLKTIEPFSQERKFGDTGANLVSELSDACRKDDDLESPWDELGPASNSGPRKNETQSGLCRKMKDETRGKIHHEYESLSDDDFTDAEDDSSEITSENKRKSIVHERDSSLLQILDSWYKTKDDCSKQSGAEDIDVLENDPSRNGPKVSSLFESTVKNETPARTNGRKKRSSKSYSFVTDEAIDNKDKLIDGILGSLKKTSERPY